MTDMSRKAHQDRYPHPLKLMDGDPPCAEVGTEFYFPDPGDSRSYRKPVRLTCFECPVQQACLDYAIHNSVQGIWGGSTERERWSYRTTHGIVPRDLSMDGFVGRGRHREDAA